MSISQYNDEYSNNKYSEMVKYILKKGNNYRFILTMANDYDSIQVDGVVDCIIYMNNKKNELLYKTSGYEIIYCFCIYFVDQKIILNT